MARQPRPVRPPPSQSFLPLIACSNEQALRTLAYYHAHGNESVTTHPTPDCRTLALTPASQAGSAR